MDVSDMVRREVETRFGERDASDVVRLLKATSLPFLEEDSHQRLRDRVHLGILKRANGDFEEFAHLLALAATDWRDLLVAAGLEHDDWPDVLRAAGYPVP